MRVPLPTLSSISRFLFTDKSLRACVCVLYAGWLNGSIGRGGGGGGGGGGGTECVCVWRTR